jgi:hypothetical protein
MLRLAKSSHDLNCTPAQVGNSHPFGFTEIAIGNHTINATLNGIHPQAVVLAARNSVEARCCNYLQISRPHDGSSSHLRRNLALLRLVSIRIEAARVLRGHQESNKLSAKKLVVRRDCTAGRKVSNFGWQLPAAQF